ncbi:MAG: YkgJ family cysteine cluster protein [Ignavibacteriales bacterium]|nr:YkgJ family cysteine cluster protein [Ignavibacteriales bacterium]
MSRFTKRVQVPCHGCTLCCQGDLIRLEPKEFAQGYATEPHPIMPGALMLAHQPNGDCIYLKAGQCGIHDHAPLMCRVADCRTIAVRFDFETARKLHQRRLIDIRVWDHGRMLIEKDYPHTF